MKQLQRLIGSFWRVLLTMLNWAWIIPLLPILIFLDKGMASKIMNREGKMAGKKMRFEHWLVIFAFIGVGFILYHFFEPESERIYISHEQDPALILVERSLWGFEEKYHEVRFINGEWRKDINGKWHPVPMTKGVLVQYRRPWWSQ